MMATGAWLMSAARLTIDRLLLSPRLEPLQDELKGAYSKWCAF